MIQVDSDNKEYFNIINKDKEIGDFAQKLETLNKWVIDESKDFFLRLQWISTGAIALSVPLLSNQRISSHTIFSYKDFQFTNLLALAISWTCFILAFLFALYRNKIHPEYIHFVHMSDWQKLHEEKLEIIVKALKDQNSNEYGEFVRKKNRVEEIKNESLFKSKIMWTLIRGFAFISQIFLILGILLFVIFGISTLFS